MTEKEKKSIIELAVMYWGNDLLPIEEYKNLLPNDKEWYNLIEKYWVGEENRKKIRYGSVHKILMEYYINSPDSAFTDDTIVIVEKGRFKKIHLPLHVKDFIECNEFYSSIHSDYYERSKRIQKYLQENKISDMLLAEVPNEIQW